MKFKYTAFPGWRRLIFALFISTKYASNTLQKIKKRSDPDSLRAEAKAADGLWLHYFNIFII